MRSSLPFRFLEVVVVAVRLVVTNASPSPGCWLAGLNRQESLYLMDYDTREGFHIPESCLPGRRKDPIGGRGQNCDLPAPGRLADVVLNSIVNTKKQNSKFVGIEN